MPFLWFLLMIRWGLWTQQLDQPSQKHRGSGKRGDFLHCLTFREFWEGKGEREERIGDAGGKGKEEGKRKERKGVERGRGGGRERKKGREEKGWERVECKRGRKTALKKKKLRIKFQDSLCAIEDEVYQQSAKGILREERDFFLLPGEGKIIRGRGWWRRGKSEQNKTKTGMCVLSRSEESWEDRKGVCTEFH